jgi:hypothetical protein
MMKWLIALAVLMLIISPAFAQENIIVNPSFENTTTADRDGYNPSNLLIPDDWFNTLSAPNNEQCIADDVIWNTKAYVNSTYGLTGSNSLMFTNDLNGDNFVCQLIQANNMSGTLTAYMDISQVTGDETPCIEMYNDVSSMEFCTKAGGNTCQIFDNCTVTNATGNWKRVELDFASGYQWFSVWFNNREGTAFFDNFSIQFDATPIPVIGSFALSPASGSHTVETPFTVNVTASSGGINIDGIDVLLTYDSSKLSVTNLVMTNGLTNVTFQNYTASTITFMQLSPLGTQIPVNTTVATVTFMPTGTGNASVDFLFTLGNTTDSNMAVNGTDILNSTTNGIYEISAAPPGPTPQPPIHGATAGIIGFLPLLIGVGLILFIARRIEDMNSTEDFIIVIVGAGLGIVFLGVFTAIIAGLI